MLLKVALVGLVFVAVHGQAIDNPEDRVANKPIARARRAVAEEMMKNLELMHDLYEANGRQRRSPEETEIAEAPHVVAAIYPQASNDNAMQPVDTDNLEMSK
ncbi:unnamed protein product [Nippostrongylus brasiliensis]|uniref:Uncharacterized protein n=1 Tax=Nippostrongylus brasiliensis TaxID=27835 RepID=A0A0N4XY60_NIPBR|nr:unnamed protein product [Nippostrongylus brasiliensis]